MSILTQGGAAGGGSTTDLAGIANSSLTSGTMPVATTGGALIDSKTTQATTAGAGPVIAAGTATTAVNALSLTQTRNNSGVTFPGVTWTFTDTAVGASSTNFVIKGGASGTTTVMSLLNTGLVTFGSGVVAAVGTAFSGAGGGIIFGNRGGIGATNDGVFQFANNAGTDFSRACYGGTTSSFPATKRSGTTLAIRLADDSADAPLTASNITASGYVKLGSYTVAGLPSASASGAGAQAFVTDANTTLALGLGMTVTGGGSNKTPVFSDGTNWIIG